jgi:3-oxoacyl-[acyl-carrier-protein] synthase II
MERVVITGLGIVSSIGVGAEEYWKNALQGKSGISEITSFDTSAFKNHLGGEIKNLDPSPFLSSDEISSMERGSILAVMAAKLAREDAGIVTDNLDR